MNKNDPDGARRALRRWTVARLQADDWKSARWWRVVRQVPNPGPGDLWCETTDEAEARAALMTAPYPARLEHLKRRVEQQDESGTVLALKWFGLDGSG